MQFPLSISFKVLTLVPQLTVRDATGAEIGYVRRQLLAFKESVTVYADESQSRPIYIINADRVIDFTANYLFAEPDGRPIGFVRREGFASLWRAHYTIHVADRPVFVVREESALVRMADSILDMIPFAGLFSGYLFNPKYLVTRLEGGPPVLRMTKRPALLETEFAIELLQPIAAEEQAATLLGIMMIILLERARG